MKDGTVSGRILAALQRSAEGDQRVVDFLMEVLYREAEGLRGRRDFYEGVIAQYSDLREAADED
jgi:hypothetical protein